MKIHVKNGSETVELKSIDEIINSEIKVDTVEFCLNKTVETELEQMAFEILQQKIENEKYKLRLEGVQSVLVLELENPNLKQEIKKCVEYIDEMIYEIRIDTGVERQNRLKACIIGNLIEAELRVQMV